VLTSAIYNEDCLLGLRRLPEDTVQCCVTSPPYFNLRDYGTATWEGGDTACDHKPAVQPRAERGRNGLTGGLEYLSSQEPSFKSVCAKCDAHRIDAQIGLEESPDAYVAKLVAVFREVKRVLRSDGVLWLNLGDSYTGSANAGGEASRTCHGAPNAKDRSLPTKRGHGLKPKDLIGIPWRVAFALQADGWYLRQDLIWHKPNPMPESVRDRCTKAHEYLFLLSKSPRYYFAADAIREPHTSPNKSRNRWQNGGGSAQSLNADTRQDFGSMQYHPMGRNKRSVWTVTPKPFIGAHFAVMPEALVEPCILAGSKEGDTVLDPFMGAGTVAVVASRLQRRYLGFELNPAYCQLAQERLHVPQQYSIKELAQCSASGVGIAADCAVSGALDAGAMGTRERLGYVCAGE
jgi:DNA modification methylase